MATKIDKWKVQIKLQAAKEFGVKPSSILLVPQGSKRGIKATWQNLGLVYCPVNRKNYRAYWVRTVAEFREGKRLDC